MKAGSLHGAVLGCGSLGLRATPHLWAHCCHVQETGPLCSCWVSVVADGDHTLFHHMEARQKASNLFKHMPLPQALVTPHSPLPARQA